MRAVKRCLKKTLGNTRVTYEEFETTLIEVEAVLNSRPLTYLTESVGEPLTPSSLCLGRRLLSHPPNTRGSITEDCNNRAAELSRIQKYLSTVRFRRLLSLLEESRYVEEMMFIRSKLLGLNKKNLQCLPPKSYINFHFLFILFYY